MAWTCSGTVALNYNVGHLPISPAQIGNIPAQREIDQHPKLSLLSDLPTDLYSLSGRHDPSIADGQRVSLEDGLVPTAPVVEVSIRPAVPNR